MQLSLHFCNTTSGEFRVVLVLLGVERVYFFKFKFGSDVGKDEFFKTFNLDQTGNQTGGLFFTEDIFNTDTVFDVLLGDALNERKNFIAENGAKYLDLADIS